MKKDCRECLKVQDRNRIHDRANLGNDEVEFDMVLLCHEDAEVKLGNEYAGMKTRKQELHKAHYEEENHKMTDCSVCMKEIERKQQ